MKSSAPTFIAATLMAMLAALIRTEATSSLRPAGIGCGNASTAPLVRSAFGTHDLLLAIQLIPWSKGAPTIRQLLPPTPPPTILLNSRPEQPANALTLARALRNHATDIDAALLRWERDQLPADRRLVHWGIALGRRIMDVAPAL